MIVVADTSPINYLVQIELIDVLRSLYAGVLLPNEVLTELLEEGAPESVRSWASQLPDWVQVRALTKEPPLELASLDSGERAAISLAIEIQAQLILADERKARRIALDSFGIAVTGTLGVLRNAHLAGYTDGIRAFEALCLKTNFHHTRELEQVFVRSLGG